jgi:DNA-binding NtrC family response regulator
MREVIATILSLRGHRCESAENGIEAMEKVMQNRFDAVITDADMHKLDGIALRKELTHHFSKLPVMIMTGDDSSEESAIDAGAREFLRKPSDLSEFIMKFHKILCVQKIATEQKA